MQPPGVDEFKKEKKTSFQENLSFEKNPSRFYFLKGEYSETPVALSLTKTFAFGPFTLFFFAPPVIRFVAFPPPQKNCYVFYFFHKCLPAALHFVAQSCHKVPLDTSAAELCGFARIRRIWVTVLKRPF